MSDGIDTFFGCVFVVLDQSREPKVGHLTDELMRNQNVCSSQVSVNVIFLLNKGHAVSHLQGTAHRQKKAVSVCSSMKWTTVRGLRVF